MEGANLRHKIIDEKNAKSKHLITVLGLGVSENFGRM